MVQQFSDNTNLYPLLSLHIMSTSATSVQGWYMGDKYQWREVTSRILEEQALEDAHPLEISDSQPRWPSSALWWRDASTILKEQSFEEESQKI
ncbi:hypothetical protein OG21DRAFT_1509748 [Imleria badia]|nr:hypothetical protein OG21DRAFT_1509748 [Imleria badia]